MYSQGNSLSKSIQTTFRNWGHVFEINHSNWKPFCRQFTWNFSSKKTNSYMTPCPWARSNWCKQWIYEYHEDRWRFVVLLLMHKGSYGSVLVQEQLIAPLSPCQWNTPKIYGVEKLKITTAGNKLWTLLALTTVLRQVLFHRSHGAWRLKASGINFYSATIIADGRSKTYIDYRF